MNDQHFIHATNETINQTKIIIGSLFEVLGGPGATTLGFAPTAALAAIGIPMSIFLIYAAIMKGAAETEEDDKEYNSPRKL